MMDKPLKDINVLSFVIHSVFGIRLLTLPRDIAEHAGNDAWIAILLSGIYLIFPAYALYWASLKYPGLNFSQVSEKVFGKIIGKAIMALTTVYTVSYIGLGLRYFADSVDVFLLDRTPRIFIICTMLFVSWYCVNKGVKTISIVFDILLPVTLISVVFLVLLPVKNADPRNLLPVFSSGIKPVLRGYLEVSDPVLACGIISYLAPYMKGVRAAKKWMFAGIATAMSITLFVVAMCIMVFGSEEVKYLVYPTLTLTKSAQLRAQIFERSESLFMAAWIPNTFTTIVAYYFVSTLNLEALFNTKKRSIVNLIQIPAFVTIALIPKNIAEVFGYFDMNGLMAQAISLIYIPIYVIGVFLKTRGQKSGKA